MVIVLELHPELEPTRTEIDGTVVTAEAVAPGGIGEDQEVRPARWRLPLDAAPGETVSLRVD